MIFRLTSFGTKTKEFERTESYSNRPYLNESFTKVFLFSLQTQHVVHLLAQSTTHADRITEPVGFSNVRPAFW